MTDSDIRFRPYRTGDKEAIISLLSAGRHEGYARAKSAIFDWQFNDNPAGTRGPHFLVGTVGDEIAAINGFMPVKTRFQGRSVTAYWSLDTFVSAQFRGRGFGKALCQIVSVQAPVMLGFGISDMYDPILEKSGWLLASSMSNLYFHAHQQGVKGLAKNLLTRATRMLHGRKGRDSAEFRLEPTIAIEELDAVWNLVRGQYESAVERDGAYLSWRYGDSPLLRYRWVAARRGGHLCALLVTRHHPVESVIADFIGPADDPDLLAGLCHAAVADLVAAGTRCIRCETSHVAVKRALRSAGFIKTRSVGRFRVRANDQPGSEAPCSWLVMTGDSDNDLLVF